MGYPHITVNIEALRENVEYCAELCHSQGITLASVTKCFCAVPEISEMLEAGSSDWLADARIGNLRILKTKKPRFLIRVSQPWEVEDTVRWSEISLQSEAKTIKLLGEAASRLGKRHSVILSCDLGDLREGCFFENKADIYATAEAVLAQPMLELLGVGMNLGCFGGVLPCQENMGGLVDIANDLRTRYGIEAPVVSGGRTTIVHDLINHTVPEGLNNCRIGELWLTGHDPGLGVDVDGFHNDPIVLSAQLVEVKEKPSKPVGPTGGDAFGIVRQWPDLGPMRRGILACGRQDMELEGLMPQDERVRVLGGSSDYTLVDLTDAPEYAVGDILTFRLNYAAVLRAFTSPYVEKIYT